MSKEKEPKRPRLAIDQPTQPTRKARQPMEVS